MSDKEVKIAEMVLPRDKDARELIEEFEAIYPTREKEYGEKLRVAHITAETSTLMKFLTLYTIALNKELVEANKCRETILKIKTMLEKSSGVKLVDEPTDF